MTNVGILGFGNLGKALLEVFERDSQIDVKAVFSRRKLNIDKYVPIEKIDEYVDKIDVLALAIGSLSDFELLRQYFVGKFNTVDSFDNHNVIENYKKSLASSKKTAIVSVGWDPGILSVVRAICSIYPNFKTTTFWGKGLSQGHSNAIRTIEGVIDGVQFTIPKKEVLEKAKNGEICTTDYTKTHTRQCFVACQNGKETDIENAIKSMPNYFEPYETIVEFVELKEVERLKLDMSHCGFVCSKNDVSNINFEIHTTSNPLLTAYTMAMYTKALAKMAKDGLVGTMDCLDVPLKYLVEDKKML